MAYAPDGSPVELYQHLSGRAEADLVAALVAPGASVLELGCGAGRVTHELAARGLRVVGVDLSAAMLAAVDRSIETVLADIATVDLGRRFDVVLLASHFLNDVDRAAVRAFLATCARHVRDDGIVLAERYPPGWVTTVAPARNERGGVTFDLHDVHRDGDVLHATITYTFEGRSFSQKFSAVEAGDDVVTRDAATAGLAFDGTVDATGTWLRFRPRHPA